MTVVKHWANRKCGTEVQHCGCCGYTQGTEQEPHSQPEGHDEAETTVAARDTDCLPPATLISGSFRQR